MHLLSAHAEAPVALVLYNAGPLNVSWAKSNPNVQAILLSYFPAQVSFIYPCTICLFIVFAIVLVT